MTDGNQPVPVTVVVPSFRRPELLDACLASLLRQSTTTAFEIVVARPGSDWVPPEGTRCPVRVVPAPEGTTLQGLRALGLAEARGALVAMTEDHCVAKDGWLDALVAALGSADVVGGGMGNAQTERAIDWGAYFAEYGVYSGCRVPADGVPAMTCANVGYRRVVVRIVARWSLEGFNEDVIHRRLSAMGHSCQFLHWSSVVQNDHYAFGAFCRDRFAHGLDYARTRITIERSRWRRGLFIVGVVLLPMLLFTRLLRSGARESPRAFLGAAPWTLAFLMAWSAGECAGYLKGPR
jgi:hypothetical protein